MANIDDTKGKSNPKNFMLYECVDGSTVALASREEQ